MSVEQRSSPDEAPAVKPGESRQRRDSDTVIAVDIDLEVIIESPRQPSSGGPPLQAPAPPPPSDRTTSSDPEVAPPPPPPPLPGPPPLTPLPSSWKEAKDPAGVVYYWNWWTRETTYTRPMPKYYAPTVKPAPVSGAPSTLARAASGFGLAKAPSFSRASSGLVDRASNRSRRESSISHHSRRPSDQRPSFSADL